MEKVATFPKYKQNLSLMQDYDGDLWVKSYDTIVARVDAESNELVQLDYWTMTTQKHINYAANEMNLKLVKPQP